MNSCFDTKIKNIVSFINNELIIFSDIKIISYIVPKNHKCEKCYQDFLNYENTNSIITKISKKKKKNLEYTLKYIQNKGVLDQRSILEYKILKKKFSSNNLNYNHYNLLISYKKLESLLKYKIKKNYKDIFNNIKYNCNDLYCCPYFEKPKQTIILNVFDNNKSLNYNKKNEGNLKDKKVSYNQNDFNVFLSKKTTITKKVVKWEKNTSSNYIRNKPVTKKIYNNKSLDIYYINYKSAINEEYFYLEEERKYFYEKKELLEELEYLEYLECNNNFNFVDEIIYIKNILSKYYSLPIEEYIGIENKIKKFIFDNINIFLKEYKDFNEDFHNINIVVEYIKDIKYYVNFGKDLIKICNKNNINSNMISKVEYGIDYLKNISKNFINKHQKKIKEEHKSIIKV